MTGQHLRGLPVFLRAPRAAGLWLAGVLIALASAVAFALSYRGLFVWALHHQWPMPWPVFFPLLIDVLIVVCEVILFVAAIDGGTPWRVRGLAWLVLLAFTGISVAGNAGHSAHADAVTRGGFALPPLVLAIALGFGLGELKRQAAKYRAGPEPGTQFLPAEFTDKAGAAEIAYRRSVTGGNPFKAYALATRFDIPRPVAAEIVERNSPAAARSASNGHGGTP